MMGQLGDAVTHPIGQTIHSAIPVVRHIKAAAVDKIAFAD